ncbi:hypothetical protein AOQ84DRAFT_357751 [Glonium stellatum]|uniref:Uncharacterized protein n=1 Tax=Glonium stellatum TaxID=574774 RepID=A0A8E2EN33_9PEZI|nr:hypothetical protein AOQ84DRAFT_357751 [Glonium stellatum]
MAATFVHEGPWNETTRQHPATKMMEAITTEFDSTNKLNPKWYAADTSFEMADGTKHHGVETVLEVTKNTYNAMTKHYHEPGSITVTETDDGYELRGKAKLYGNLADGPPSGKNQVEDSLGRKWDVVIPGDWVNWYVKDDGADNGMGMLIKKSRVNAESQVKGWGSGY